MTFASRLLEDQVCNEANIPSISSINRIIRDKGFKAHIQVPANSLTTYMCIYLQVYLGLSTCSHVNVAVPSLCMVVRVHVDTTSMPAFLDPSTSCSCLRSAQVMLHRCIGRLNGAVMTSTLFLKRLLHMT